MRKCKSCFRYVENWRDARAKGLKERESSVLADYSYKPRKGIKVMCMRAYKVEVPGANDKGCEFHEYRWLWNLKTWWERSFKYRLRRLLCDYIICPIGGLRKPVPLEWEDSFDGMRDKIIPNGEPICPHCGEMPYSTEQCVFCGQRFIKDKQTEEFEKPSEIERTNCIMCGSVNSVVGTRAKTNGHFHGKCEKCGAVCME